jgi:hypothetical protein
MWRKRLIEWQVRENFLLTDKYCASVILDCLLLLTADSFTMAQDTASVVSATPSVADACEKGTGIRLHVAEALSKYASLNIALNYITVIDDKGNVKRSLNAGPYKTMFDIPELWKILSGGKYSRMPISAREKMWLINRQINELQAVIAAYPDNVDLHQAMIRVRVEKVPRAPKRKEDKKVVDVDGDEEVAEEEEEDDQPSAQRRRTGDVDLSGDTLSA